MNEEQQKAVLAIALLAAFADGEKAEAEREEIRRVAETLGAQSGMPALLRDVLLKRIDAAAAAAQLPSVELRQLAYELAVGVCEADGVRNADETRFLAELAQVLGLSRQQAQQTVRTADELAMLPLDDAAQPGGSAAPAERPADGSAAAASSAAASPPPASSAAGTSAAGTSAAGASAAGTSAVGTSAVGTLAAGTSAAGTSAAGTSAGAASAPGASAPGPVVSATPRRPEAEIDAMILNYAILNGALELLPQSTASMAIIPLQMKMVYRIGKDYGYELDRGHVKDFLATVGVGMTGQYLEEIGRKLIGGLFGKAAGKMLGGLARGATGIAFSFVTTYALGQVARRYYAGGRVMSAQLLKDTYAATLGQAKAVQSQYMPQIEQRARTIDVGQIVQMVRGQ